MSRDWQPGDVGVAPFAVAGPKRVFRDRHGYWWDSDGEQWNRGLDDRVRPLVVIDPEDEDAAFRLIDLYFSGGADRLNARAMQAALREFADPKPPKPPKPEEPTGRFAEVVDSTGDHWFLMYADETKSAPWARDGCFTAPTTWRGWRDIDAVKVLRDGIPA